MTVAVGFLVLLPLGQRAMGMESRDIDALVDAYLTARSPSERLFAFAEASLKIREARNAGDREGAMALATRFADSVKDDPELLSRMASQIGQLHVLGEDWGAAKTQFARALMLEEGRAAKGIERFESPLMWLAGVSIRLGALDEAEGHYLRLLDMKRQANGPAHYSTIGQLWALAHLSLRRQDFAKAEQYVRQELAIWQTKPTFMGVALGDASKALQNLGAIRAHQGKWAEAVDLHLQARVILNAPIAAQSDDAQLGAGDLARAIECEERLAVLYGRLGDAAKADAQARSVAKLKGRVTRPAVSLSDPLWFQSVLPLPEA